MAAHPEQEETSFVEFLREKGLEKYAEELEKRDITCLGDLKELNESDLMELGRQCHMSLGHLAKFRNLILSSPNPLLSSRLTSQSAAGEVMTAIPLTIPELEAMKKFGPLKELLAKAHQDWQVSHEHVKAQLDERNALIRQTCAQARAAIDTEEQRAITELQLLAGRLLKDLQSQTQIVTDFISVSQAAEQECTIAFFNTAAFSQVDAREKIILSTTDRIYKTPFPQLVSQPDLKLSFSFPLPRITLSTDITIKQFSFAFGEIMDDHMIVEFRSLTEPDNVEKRFSLPCQKTFSYQELQRVVGAHLGADPAKIRFTGMKNNQPRIAPCDETANLQKMIQLYDEKDPEVLFFELFNVRLDQIELMKKVKIEYHCANGKSLPPITLYVPKNGVIRDIFPLLRQVKEVKEVLASPVKDGLTTATGRFRLIELWSSKIGRVWNGSDRTIHLYEYTTFVVQETLAEEVDFKPETDLLIHVSHISLPDMLRIPTLHGRPFFFVVKTTETFASVKERIRQKLQLTPEEIAPWKLYHCCYSVYKLLTDTATVGQHSWDRVSSYLGLEHPDPHA